MDLHHRRQADRAGHGLRLHPVRGAAGAGRGDPALPEPRLPREAGSRYGGRVPEGWKLPLELRDVPVPHKSVRARTQAAMPGAGRHARTDL